MSRTDSPWLQNAFSIVGQHDPRILAAMKNSNWNVDVISNQQDVNQLVGLMNPVNAANALDGALGFTCMDSPRTPYYLRGRSWLVRPKIHLQAAQLGVTASELAASVLVHEYIHTLGYGEKEAYEAQVLFARRMGLPAIAEAFTEVGRRELLAEAQATHGRCPFCGRNH